MARCRACVPLHRSADRSIDRSITTMAYYVKKKDEHHAVVNKTVLKDAGFPVHRVGGGNTDHPAQSEIRKLVRLCKQHGEWILLWLGCGNHKTNLLMVHFSKILCRNTERGVFCHKQTAFLLRYIAEHTPAFAAYAEDFTGCKGWWCNIAKMQQDQRCVTIQLSHSLSPCRNPTLILFFLLLSLSGGT